ncbi:MAG: PAS domain-containing protein [Bacteroidia bacterium]|nr:PAS domain-containing protein [Bacteroidia bacterium]
MADNPFPSFFLDEIFNTIDSGIEYLKAVRNSAGEIVDFEFAFINKAAKKFVPTKQAIGDTIIGTTLLSVFPGVKHSSFSDFVQVVETGIPYQNTVFYPYENVNRWYSQEVKKLGDGFVIVFEDITQRMEQAKVYTQAQQKVEDRLQQAELKFEAIFNQTYQFIGLLSPEGILLEVNETALAFGGLTREDVVEKPFWEAYWWTMSEVSQNQLKESIQQAATGTFIRYNVEVLGKDRQVITIDFSIKPVFNQENKVQWLIAEGRDITRMVSLSKDLMEKTLLLKNLIDHFPLIQTEISGMVLCSPPLVGDWLA